VLTLLFTIAEYGAESQSVYHNSALAAMEILTEIMYKKYIPSSASATTTTPVAAMNSNTITGGGSVIDGNGSRSSGMGMSGTGSGAALLGRQQVDQGAMVLMHVVMKVVTLLQRYR
jgi:hypothetical protein